MSSAAEPEPIDKTNGKDETQRDSFKKASEEYEKYVKSKKRARRSFLNKIGLSVFIGLCMLTDVWKVLHNLFPDTVPNYEKSFTETVKALSSVSVEPYKYGKHHGLEDLAGFISSEALEYLIQSYSTEELPNEREFLKLAGLNYTRVLEDVKEAVKHSWEGYRLKGWGFDSVKPVSGKGVNDFSGLSMTLIDSIDTLYLAGMHEEIKEIKEWMVSNFRLETQQNVNIFEMNIRILGGLLSAYHLTKDEDYLTFSEYVASKIIRAFVEPSGIPYGIISFGETVALKNSQWTKSCTSVAEAGTLSLELEYVSRVSDKTIYSHPITKLNKQFHKLVFTNVDRRFEESGNADLLRSGLLPSYIEPISASFAPCISHQKYSFGGSIDSVYEYFLKLYIVTGKRNKKLKELYLAAIEGGMKHLLRVTKGKKKFVYFGEQSVTSSGNAFLKNMDHLACYTPGMLALGVYHNITSPEESATHIDLAKHLMRTCYNSYKTTKTGLAPEAIAFSRVHKGVITEIGPKIGSKHSFNRPETVESLYFMYKVTGDPIYRLWAFEIFKAIQKHARVKYGYSGIQDVDKEPKHVTYNDKMESFFISETLKYLLLIFEDENLFPMDKYVFNTEAHPIPIVGK